jgi:hypothetical protein
MGFNSAFKVLNKIVPREGNASVNRCISGEHDAIDMQTATSYRMPEGG